jgi:hypothetical protein
MGTKLAPPEVETLCSAPLNPAFQPYVELAISQQLKDKYFNISKPTLQEL